MKRIGVILMISLLSMVVTGCSSQKNAESDNNSSITSKADISVSPEVTEIPPTQTPQTETVNSEGTVEEIKYESAAIAKNIVGQSAERTIYIYLPPSYSTSDKTYPVVYFLHGYGDSPKAFMNTYQSKFDELFQGGSKEFILVALDGNTSTGGSFYVNSEASGNWEDYVVNELVSYMDDNYRTIADVNSRGIAGYSMGGFGALNLSLKHPDVFCSTLVFCPGIFAENDLDAVLSTWNGALDVQKTYAQAFSPNTSDTDNFGNVLQPSDIEAKNQVWEDWMNGFSNWDQKLEDYLALNQPLKSIMVNYSESDYYDWIPRGCRDLLNMLEDNGINHSSEQFDGGHIVPNDAPEKFFVPFFGENLNY